MKVTLEIDLPYLTEEGEIENDIQEQIIKGAIDKLHKGLEAAIKPMLDKATDDFIKQKVNDVLSGYLNKPVTVSNGYKKEEYASVIDMVEAKFSSLYDQKFAQTGSCGGQDPILKKIDDSIKYKVDNLISTMNSTIERQAKTLAEKAVKESSLYEVLKTAGVVK